MHGGNFTQQDPKSGYDKTEPHPQENIRNHRHQANDLFNRHKRYVPSRHILLEKLAARFG